MKRIGLVCLGLALGAALWAVLITGAVLLGVVGAKSIH